MNTFQFHHRGQTYDGYLETHHRYADNDNTACRLLSKIPDSDEYEVYATLSVNTDERLPEGTFVFKTYSENAGLYEEMLRLQLVKHTGRFVPVGYAGAQPIVELVSNEVALCQP